MIYRVFIISLRIPWMNPTSEPYLDLTMQKDNQKVAMHARKLQLYGKFLLYIERTERDTLEMAKKKLYFSISDSFMTIKNDIRETMPRGEIIQADTYTLKLALESLTSDQQEVKTAYKFMLKHSFKEKERSCFKCSPMVPRQVSGSALKVQPS